MRPTSSFLVALVTVAAFASGMHAQSAAPTGAITLRVSAQRDTTLTGADLARLPRSEVRVAPPAHGADTTHAQVSYEGVALSELLALVGAPMGSALRGRAVASYILIEAADGYRVVFSLEEVESTSSTPRVLLADRRNGVSLSSQEGPLRVIAPNARHSRWIRQVVRISVRDAAPSAQTP
jgi:DMSO/TMAO reductase YedYZ molybdopterin-dependent catalytic subunit